MNLLEIIAAVLGVINVVLITRRTAWNYPFGIAMVCLYAYIFYEFKLYSDALLQGFFLIVQLYGWANWTRAAKVGGGVVTGVLSWPQRALWLVVACVLSLTIGTLMDRFTDAAVPYVDASIAGFSVVAQILMAIRKIENWVLWIGVDIVAVGLFASRGLYVTSGLYAIFLGLCIVGFLGWRKTLPAARA